MNFVSILKILLSLASTIAGYVRDRQLMNAGAAESILKGLNDANDAIARANAARANVDSLPVNADEANRDNK